MKTKIKQKLEQIETDLNVLRMALGYEIIYGQHPNEMNGEQAVRIQSNVVSSLFNIEDAIKIFEENEN